MLTLFWSDGETCRREVDPPDPSLPANAVWFDLFDPDPERQRAVEAATGLVLPMSQNVAEIESSISSMPMAERSTSTCLW